MDRSSPCVDLFISAAEHSGDLHGASLIEQLLSLNPSLQIAAISGPRMCKLPIKTLYSMDQLQVMGFTDVFWKLPKIFRFFFRLRKALLALQPKVMVFIDYPGFHLALERSLRKKGYQGKLIHYISPTVWAWKKGRIRSMAQNLDLLLTILPFEPKCYENTNLPVKYVGHPLISAVLQHRVSQKFKNQKIIALFPGSRQTEIDRNLDFQLSVAKKLISIYPDLEMIISDVKTFSTQDNYDLMARCHFAIATSGTAALELALHKAPTVVTFAIKKLDCFIAQKIFRINLPYYSLPNILLQKSVFPELFGPHLTEERLYDAAHEMCFNEEKRQICRQDCEEIWKVLGKRCAAKEAAQTIETFFET